MTAIAGYSDSEGTYWMIADKRETAGDCYWQTNTPKICEYKNYIVGAAGDAHLCNMVVHHVTPPKWRKSSTPISYYTRDLVAAWVAEAKAQSYDPGELEVLLVTPEHGLWYANGLGSVSSLTSPIWAIGTGAPYMLGAWEILYGWEVRMHMHSESTHKSMMLAAAKYVPSVSTDLIYVGSNKTYPSFV